MSNWFQDHPMTTVISHSIIVGTAVWLVSYFVLDENKVNFYRAQAENAATVAEQHKAKVSVLEAELLKLKSENERYLSWLSQDPKAFPALVSRINDLERDLVEAKANSLGLSSGVDDSKPNEVPYEFSKAFSKGESFIDPKTRVIIGVSDVSSNYTASGTVALPDGKKIKLEGARPGESWDFSKGGKNYRLTLDSVNWINNSLKASVSEVSE